MVKNVLKDLYMPSKTQYRKQTKTGRNSKLSILSKIRFMFRFYCQSIGEM